MKRTLLLIGIICFFSTLARTQEAAWPIVVSDDLHFWASFPVQPKHTRSLISTDFGSGQELRWSLELPDRLYDVSVIELADVSIKMDGRSLNRFYDLVTNDLNKKYGVKFGYSTVEMFGELGRIASRDTSDQSITVQMFLIHNRLYQVRVISPRVPPDEVNPTKMSRFLDGFVFMHKRKSDNEYIYGLPKYASQNRDVAARN